MKRERKRCGETYFSKELKVLGDKQVIVVLLGGNHATKVRYEEGKEKRFERILLEIDLLGRR